MSSIGTGYDLYTSQFSPDGRVFQIDYALKCVENSGTAIALRGKDGVVFAVEKIVTSKLYEKGANKRIFNIDNHVGMVTSGLYADARQLAETASNEASNYRQDYGSAVPTEFLANRVSMYMHAYTLYSAVRPYGSTLMLGSWTDIAGPKLFCIEPSGTSYAYWGCAAGKAKQAAKTEIEKLELKNMACKDLINEAAKIIYMVHDEVKDKMFELELSWVTKDTNGKHIKVSDQVHKDAEKFAHDALEEDSDSEGDD
jgi:20S proteasome subunit alpha 7